VYLIARIQSGRNKLHFKQGSVATYARCGGILNNHFTANSLNNLPVKEF